LAVELLRGCGSLLLLLLQITLHSLLPCESHRLFLGGKALVVRSIEEGGAGLSRTDALEVLICHVFGEVLLRQGGVFAGEFLGGGWDGSGIFVADDTAVEHFFVAVEACLINLLLQIDLVSFLSHVRIISVCVVDFLFYFAGPAHHVPCQILSLYGRRVRLFQVGGSWLIRELVKFLFQ